MRLDKFLFENYPQRFPSRTKAAEAINCGLVLVDGRACPPSFDVADGAQLAFVQPEEQFVSNGGYKLSKALKDFNFCVKDNIVVDVGASNGGFTDCLFQNGARKVYCVDVGENQLDSSLLDKNIVILDNFNARELSASLFEDTIDGAVIDVSFISLTYILHQVASLIRDGGFIIALIKPQFECERRRVGKNGIVKDPLVRKQVIKKIYDYSLQCGLSPVNLTTAPVKEGKNIEYLLLLKKCDEQKIDINSLYKYAKI